MSLSRSCLCSNYPLHDIQIEEQMILFHVPDETISKRLLSTIPYKDLF